MTDYHPVTKEHCNHECTCGRYLGTALPYKKPCPAGTDIYDNCTHDTRSRPDPLALLDKWLYVQYELSGEIDI